MAKKTIEKVAGKSEKKERAWKKIPEGKKKEERKIEEISLVRILATDIPGKMGVYSGLTKIKGVSWSFSNAVCRILNLNKNKKISELGEGEIRQISQFIKNPALPNFILNRRRDFESGEDRHIISTDVDLQREFDVKRLKKIRSYKGLRHATGQPVRGQRTKSHFRKHRAVGVIGKKKKGKKG